MSRKLSERQQNVLKFLREYMQENGYPPTVREIGEAINVKSTSLVSYYLKALESRDLIIREPSVSRGIRLVEDIEPTPVDTSVVPVPFLGYIVASAPIPVEALAGDETVDINRALYGGDVDNLFALRVRGNSMIDALINDGDLIILRHQEQVENGEMAAVWVTDGPGETTLKKVYYEGKQVRLQPANPTMNPIYVPAEAVQIQGKVVMVVRRME